MDVAHLLEPEDRQAPDDHGHEGPDHRSVRRDADRGDEAQADDRSASAEDDEKEKGLPFECPRMLLGAGGVENRESVGLFVIGCTTWSRSDGQNRASDEVNREDGRLVT